MKKRYVILQDHDHDRFEQTVERYLKDGWYCQSGVSIAYDEHGARYAQAMRQNLIAGTSST